MIEHDTRRIAARLKAICDDRFQGMPTHFAKALDVSYENLRQYLAGRAIPGNRMQARLRALGIDPEWVIYGTGRLPLSGHADLGKALTTPQVMRDKSFAVYDEVPRTADDFENPADLYQPWTTEDFSSKAYVFLQLTKEMAESLKPVLASGDLVLISRQHQASNGDLVAARWDDGPGAIKIFRNVDGKVGLWSINPSIEPLILPKKVVSLYRVVLIRKKHA